MKGRSGRWRNNPVKPGGRSIPVLILLLSFYSTLVGQEPASIHHPDLLGTTGMVISTANVWSPLGGPLMVGDEQGWQAGIFASRPYGLPQLQLLGGALVFASKPTGMGLGYVRSYYDGRGSQRLGLSVSSRGQRAILALQLNAWYQKWQQASPGTYHIYSSVALAFQVQESWMIGCLIRAPESLAWTGLAISSKLACLVCEVKYKPDEKVVLTGQVAKNSLYGLEAAAGISFGARDSWQAGAGFRLGPSIYQLHLMIPASQLKVRLNLEVHRYLGSNPGFGMYGTLKD